MMPRTRPIQSIPQPRGVAQLVEHRSPKPGVAGSSPVAPAPTWGNRRGSPTLPSPPRYARTGSAPAGPSPASSRIGAGICAGGKPVVRARIKTSVVPGALGSSSSSGHERFAPATGASGGLDPAEPVQRSTESAQFGIGSVRDRLSSGSAQFGIGPVQERLGSAGPRASRLKWPSLGPATSLASEPAIPPAAPRAPDRDAHLDPCP